MQEELVKYIRELFEEPEKFIPLHEPRFVGNEKKYVLETIESTFVSSVGKFVDRFEEMMCEITGAKHAIAIVNGTSALHLALVLAGVEKDDEVLTQALTFVATANAITYCNASPHFVDVDSDTLGLSPSLLRKHLNEIAEVKGNACYNKLTGKRIAACVPMHTFGLPTRIDELVELCNEFHIPLVEDAAESLGASYKGKQTGTFGLLGVFSFNGNKTVTAGGGGAIVTDDEGLAKLAKHLSTQAKVPHKWQYHHDHIGYNYRMPNLNAALACAQLENLSDFIQNKRELAECYLKFFESYPEVILHREIEEAKSNYWLNAIQLASREKRDEFLSYMNEQGVMTRPIWTLMNKLDMFLACPKSDLSNALYLEDRIVNLPSSVRI